MISERQTAPSSRQNGYKCTWRRQNMEIPIGNSRRNVVGRQPAAESSNAYTPTKRDDNHSGTHWQSDRIGSGSAVPTLPRMPGTEPLPRSHRRERERGCCTRQRPTTASPTPTSGDRTSASSCATCGTTARVHAPPWPPTWDDPLDGVDAGLRADRRRLLLTGRSCRRRAAPVPPSSSTAARCVASGRRSTSTMFSRWRSTCGATSWRTGSSRSTPAPWTPRSCSATSPTWCATPWIGSTRVAF